MIIELQRFVEFMDSYRWQVGDPNRSKKHVRFEPMTINTDYVAWIRRVDYDIPNTELCEVHFADRGQNFVFDISYEKMRELLTGGRGGVPIK